MAKKLSTGGLISPTNLWGKPLPTTKPAANKPAKEKVTRKMTADDDIMDDEIDVDAELAEADIENDEVEAIAPEDDSEVTGKIDVGDEDEEDSEDTDDDEEPDYEDDDVEDESLDVVEDEDEEVVTAVADDADDSGNEKDVSNTTEDIVVMAEKMSLSDHVRAEIARRHKTGESLRGKDIVATLEKRKITVSPAQVSQLLKKAGHGGKSRTSAPPAATAATQPTTEKSRAALKAKKRGETAVKVSPVTPPRQAPKARPATGNGFKVPMSQLQAAEAFVAACGGSFQAANHILTAAKQLSQTFGG